MEDNMSEEIEFIKSNKGGVKIIHKGYMYTVHKNKKNGGIRWRCAQRSLQCRGSISTGPNCPPKLNMPHNHLPDPRSIALARGKPEENEIASIFDIISECYNNQQGSGVKQLHILRNNAVPSLFLPPPPEKWNIDIREKILDSQPFVVDSMPLEQRMSQSPIDLQEPVLQSQPLSPTKLKVTRQTAKPPQFSPKPPTPEPVNEEVCLRWNSHHSNMQTAFPTLLLREQYVDVTLVAEGRTLKCHRLILSSCSPYFEEVLSGISPFQHPVLFMKDVPFWILKSLCDFMYAGEVHIFQNKLEELLSVAEALKIKGLAGKSNSNPEDTKPEDKKLPEPQKSNLKPIKSTYIPKKVETDNEDILDPLDLLEPVYEELTKDSKPSTSNIKPKESKYVQIKKTFPKKIKKRKISEEREESPPSIFQTRKGTRSRPNVKIPKYYHTHYETISKTGGTSETTIEHEPHRNFSDPLMELDEIKSEPLDPEDDVIEIENNTVSFSDEGFNHEEATLENYYNPLCNISELEDKKPDRKEFFKKISLRSQPNLMRVKTVSKKSGANLQIINLSKDGRKLLETKAEEILDSGLEIIDTTNNKVVSDPLSIVQTVEDKITITDVRTVENEAKELEPVAKNKQETNELLKENLLNKPENELVRDEDKNINEIEQVTENKENEINEMEESTEEENQKEPVNELEHLTEEEDNKKEQDVEMDQVTEKQIEKEEEIGKEENEMEQVAEKTEDEMEQELNQIEHEETRTEGNENDSSEGMRDVFNDNPDAQCGVDAEEPMVQEIRVIDNFPDIETEADMHDNNLDEV